jgi:hypothetical protein
MVSTSYHKSINKTLVFENYFCALQRGLLLRNNHPEHTSFAIGILKGFGKDITNTWSIWLAINKL